MAIKINGVTVIDDSRNGTLVTSTATGNVVAGNVTTGGLISAAGNITGNFILGNGSQLTGIDATSIQSGTSNVRVLSSGGNVSVGVGGTSNVTVFSTAGQDVAGRISATGNITGNYIFGNGSQLTGIDATSIQNGTANVRTFLNGNVTTSAGGTANVLVVTSTGAEVAGTVSATGNVTGGGITLSGNTILSTGTTLTIDPSSTGLEGNVVIAGNLSVQGNVTYIDSSTITTNEKDIVLANNVNTQSAVNGAGLLLGNNSVVTFTYNNTSNAWTTNVGVSAVGNVIGGNVSGTLLTGTLTTAAQPNVTSVGTLTSLNSGAISSSGNVTGANILTGGLVSATGNVTGANLNLSGDIFDTGALTINTASNGNITLAPNGTGNVNVGRISASGNITASTYFGTIGTASQTNITGLGTITTGVWQGSSISTTYTDAKVTSVNGSTGAVTGLATTSGTLAQFAATTSAQLAGVISDETGSGSLVFATSPTLTTPNIGAATGTSLNVSTGSVTLGSIVNANANGVGNIGSATTYFNTVHAKATSAQYADLAEMYEADGPIEPGTVVAFGGAREVTTCGEDSSRRVAGVVSTNPSYIMNAGLAGDNVVAVALTGRVPTRVTGTIRKGDLMVAAGGGRARADANPAVGAVIGKALADFDGAEGVIEVVVGRL